MTKPMKTKPGRQFGFSATLYNDLVDMANNRKREFGGAGQGGGPSSPTTIMIKNDTVTDIANRFAAMEISETVGSDADHANLKVCKATIPTSALRPTAIIQAPVKAGDLVEAVIGGTTMVRVDVKATTDTHAEPVANSTTLRSGTTGRFRLLTPPGSTGVQNILARFESSTPPQGNPRIKNLSGYQVPEWGFLMIDGVETTPTADLDLFKSAPVFRGVLPNPLSVFAGKRIVSVPGGALVGETVDCVLDGRVPARIDTEIGATPLMCNICGDNSINDVTKLRARYDQTNFGFPILYRDPNNADGWGLIDLMPQNQPAVIVGVWRGGQSGQRSIPDFTLSSSAGPNFWWEGNPFTNEHSPGTSDLGNFVRNGITKADFFDERIFLPGPTTWMGTAQLDFSMWYQGLIAVSGTPFFRYPGMTIRFKVTGPKGMYSTLGFDDVGSITFPPGIVHNSDVAQMSAGLRPYSLTVPFFFSGSGDIRFRVEGNIIGVGQVRVKLTEMTFYIHEVDPLLAKFGPAARVPDPKTMSLSSGSKLDVISALQKPNGSGYLRMGSGGLRGVSGGSPSSGGGGGPVFE